MAAVALKPGDWVVHTKHGDARGPASHCRNIGKCAMVESVQADGGIYLVPNERQEIGKHSRWENGDYRKARVEEVALWLLSL